MSNFPTSLSIGPDEAEQDSLRREGYLSKIAGCTTIGQLFSLTNEALSKREAWGDGLQSSAAAANLWLGCAFPLACEDEGALIHGVLIPKESYLALGFESAKSIAIALLQPMPERSDGFTPWKHIHQDLLAKHLSIFESHTKAIKGSKRLTLSDVIKVEKPFFNPALLWELAKRVPNFEHLSRSLLNPESDIFRNEAEGRSHIVSSAQWKQTPLCEDAAMQLLQAIKLSFISAGPGGGMDTINRGCALVHSAYVDMSVAANIPTSQLGLGLEGISLNLTLAETVACYLPEVKAIGFGVLPAYLGHEWTHLLDYAIQERGDLDQQERLKELKESLQSIPPDEQKAREYRQKKKNDLMSTFGHFIAHKGLASLKRTALLGTAEEPLCSDAFMEQCVQACKKGPKYFHAFLESMRDPQAPSLDLSGVQFNFERIQRAYGFDKDGLDEASDFTRTAVLLDRDHPEYDHYYVSTTEMIARAATSHWLIATGANSPSLASREEPAIPEGSEALFLSKKYEAVLDAVRANPLVLQSLRVRSRMELPTDMLHSDRHVPHPMPRRMSPSAWRSVKSLADLKGQFLSEDAKTVKDAARPASGSIKKKTSGS